MSKTHLRNLFYGFCAFLFTGVFVFYFFRVWANKDPTDFDVYYHMGERFYRQQWDLLYNYVNDGRSPFRYAPPLIPLFKPLYELYLPDAKAFWYLLQCISVLFGFSVLFLCIRSMTKNALVVTLVVGLICLRYFIDSVLSGQISPMIFLFLSSGVYFALGTGRVKRSLAGAFFVFPTLAKLGPGAFLILIGGPRAGKFKFEPWPWLAALMVTFLLSLICIYQLGSWDVFLKISKDWTTVVGGHSDYFDSSHDGSQALYAVLLRAAKLLPIDPKLSMPWVSALWMICAIFGASVLVYTNYVLRPKTPRAEGLMISMGVFLFLIFMPETFKNAMLLLAIPFMFLGADVRFLTIGWARSWRWRVSIIVILILMGGLISPHVLGRDLAGAVQRLSFPFLAMVLTSWISYKELRAESERIL